MKKVFVTIPIALVAATAAVASNANPSPVHITAVVSKFTPAKVTLQKGVTTDLVFTDNEGVHSIESSALGIPQTTLLPGKTVTIPVTPKADGTFVLRCETFCGEDHDAMSLVVNVGQ